MSTRNFAEEIEEQLKGVGQRYKFNKPPQINFYSMNEWIQFREYVCDFMPIPKDIRTPITFMGVLCKVVE